MRKRKHKVIKRTFMVLVLIGLLFLFLSHRLSASAVLDKLEKVDYTTLLQDIQSMQKDGMLTAQSKINPMPISLQNMGVQKVYIADDGFFYAVLDYFFMTETGFLVVPEKGATCKSLQANIYCKKLADKIFYYHFPML